MRDNWMLGFFGVFWLIGVLMGACLTLIFIQNRDLRFLIDKVETTFQSYQMLQNELGLRHLEGLENDVQKLPVPKDK
jgi:hypothetical protein